MTLSFLTCVYVSILTLFRSPLLALSHCISGFFSWNRQCIDCSEPDSHMISSFLFELCPVFEMCWALSHFEWHGKNSSPLCKCEANRSRNTDLYCLSSGLSYLHYYQCSNAGCETFVFSIIHVKIRKLIKEHRIRSSHWASVFEWQWKFNQYKIWMEFWDGRWFLQHIE